MNNCPECHSFTPSSCKTCMNRISKIIEESYKREKQQLETHSEGLFTWEDYEEKPNE